MHVGSVKPEQSDLPIVEEMPSMSQRDSRCNAVYVGIEQQYNFQPSRSPHLSERDVKPLGLPKHLAKKRKKLDTIPLISLENYPKKEEASRLDKLKGRLPSYSPTVEILDSTPQLALKEVTTKDSPSFMSKYVVPISKYVWSIFGYCQKIVELITSIVKISIKYLTDISLINLSLIRECVIFKTTKEVNVYYDIHYNRPDHAGPTYRRLRTSSIS